MRSPDEADLFDTRDIHDDPGHWDALARRVAANALHSRGFDDSGLEWLARQRTAALAAGLLLGAGLFSLFVPDADTVSRSDWTEAIAPSDDVGRAMMLGDPPSIGELLLGRKSGA